MKEEWKPDALRETAEEIRSAVMPKSITPEMVGGTLLGVVNILGETVEKIAGVGVCPFAGFEDIVSDIDEDAYAEGAVVFSTRTHLFYLKLTDGTWELAGSDYNIPNGGGGLMPRLDKLYRCGGRLYHAGYNERNREALLPLVDSVELAEIRQGLAPEYHAWLETDAGRIVVLKLPSVTTAEEMQQYGYGYCADTSLYGL